MAGDRHPDGPQRWPCQAWKGDPLLLFCGQKVGSGGPRVDLAIDVLEGATIVARGGLKALSAVALAEEPGGFLDPPQVYMDKIAVGLDVRPRASSISTPRPAPTSPRQKAWR